MKRLHSILCFFGLVLLLTSCQNYYLARNVKPEMASIQVDSFQNQGKYFVFHGDGKPVHMKNLSVLNDQTTLRFVADTLSAQHKLHLAKGRNGTFRYKKYHQFDPEVLREVHVYAPSASISLGQEIAVPMSQVQKIEVLEIDKRRTRNSQTWGAIGYSLGAAAIILGILGTIAVSNIRFN